MEDAIVYDKAKYHYDGDYPEDLPIEQAFVHAGMYLGWLIDNDLCSDEFKSDYKDKICEFKEKRLSGAKIYEDCDGCLMDDMLNDEGNNFTQFYFDQYLNDYEAIADAAKLPSVYHLLDAWENYDLVKKIIDLRYNEWKKGERGGGSKWWKFWK